MTGQVKLESGLSLLSRLVARPRVDTCLGPGLGPLTHTYTCLSVTGEHQDSVSLLASYTLDLVIRTLLPRTVKEIELGGCEAGLVMVDCWHQLRLEQVASRLQETLREAAQQHYRSLKEAGLSREEREGRRLTSSDQWAVVKASLSRLFLLTVFSPDSLEVTLVSLHSLLLENTCVSLVLISGVNSFYHQVHNDEGINYSAYMRRIKGLVLEGLGDTKDQVRVLAVEVNIFGENNESFSSEKRLVIRNTGAEVTNQVPRDQPGPIRGQCPEELTNQKGVTLSYGDRSVIMRLQDGRIFWS